MKFILAAALLIASQTTFASIGFDQVSQTDLDNVIEEFSASSAFQSLSPASSDGDIIGFQVGLLAGMSASPEIEKLAKRTDASLSFPNLYHAGLFASVSVPFGLTGEIFVLPKMTASGASLSENAFAVKWTFYELALFSFAARYFMADSKLEFSQLVNGTQGDVAIKNKVNGLQLLVSHDFLFVEPYAGIGSLHGSGDIDIRANNQTFLLSGQQTGSSSANTTQTIVGAQFNLLFFKLGLEYSNAFNKSRYDLKLATGF